MLFVSTEFHACTRDIGTLIVLMGGKIKLNNIDEGFAMLTTYTDASVSTRGYF